MNSLTTNIKAILSVLVVIFVFTYFFYCAVDNVKPDPQILIAVVGASGTVLGYWFGSSSGSAKKDETIADVVNTPTVTQTGDKPVVNT